MDCNCALLVATLTHLHRTIFNKEKKRNDHRFARSLQRPGFAARTSRGTANDAEDTCLARAHLVKGQKHARTQARHMMRTARTESNNKYSIHYILIIPHTQTTEWIVESKRKRKRCSARIISANDCGWPAAVLTPINGPTK